MSKLRFFNIFFLKPGLTKKFHFYKGPPILTRWRCLLYDVQDERALSLHMGNFFPTQKLKKKELKK